MIDEQRQEGQVLDVVIRRITYTSQKDIVRC